MNTAWSQPKRVDLHCHSEASNKAGEVVLNAISCPECYSAPLDVHAQAKRRGMDFVSITDHDTIDGVMKLKQHKSDVLVGEELTCWFPEDNCKLHVLVYGIDAEQHAELQRRAHNIYNVAELIESQRIAHSVAHPIYRQNDKLERWHVERLILLFKGFECLNGMHSSLHREAFEPVLDRLTEQEIRRLSGIHALAPRWPEPWVKARTAGSDDHGLLNVGRTWTEFPAEVSSPGQLLDCLRSGMCRPGGEAGSSAKLAHTIYGTGVRYYSRHVMKPGTTPSFATTLLQMIVGERPAPTKTMVATAVIRSKTKKLFRRIASPFRKPHEEEHSAILKRLFVESLRRHAGDYPQLRQTLDQGLPPLGEHEVMFDFVSKINRDISQALAAAVSGSIRGASFTGLFDAISAIMAQQFIMAPYYFAVFHQNKERHLLRQITAQHTPKNPSTLKVALFTDTLDEVNGVARFLRDMSGEASRLDRHFTIHTSSAEPRVELPNRKNFVPLLSRPLPFYKDLTLTIPPILEVLEWADRQQFDVVHVSTPGAMGLCGMLVARMLRVPLLVTYHADYPAYVEKLTSDHRVTRGTVSYMKWFHAQASAVFSRSSAYRFQLGDLGISEQKMRVIPSSVNVEKFHPSRRDDTVWQSLGITEPHRLLYVGRVSVEKNLPMLTEAFRRLCEKRRDAALVVAGDGPHLEAMRKALTHLPAYFLGFQNDAQLGALYASADLLVFPSRTDTLGQVVMEAQASGLPVLVTPDGGPKESIEDGRTGIVVPEQTPQRWAVEIENLLDDPGRRQRMAQAAVQRAARWSLTTTFEAFWLEHLRACEQASAEPAGFIPPAVAITQ